MNMGQKGNHCKLVFGKKSVIINTFLTVNCGLSILCLRQFTLRELFKKLRREKLRPKNKTPSHPPFPPLVSFFATQKITPIFLSGNASIMGKTNFTLGPM